MYPLKARFSWRRLLRQTDCLACSLAFFRAGKRRAAKMAMMAMTTNSSMSVKAREEGKGGRLEDCECDGLPSFHSSILPLLLTAAASASSASRPAQADRTHPAPE